MTSDSHFENAVFRYRSIDALLGEHEELERQTVYFAPPEYLNDPMEGLRQVYWRGDRIMWRNLLRHYIICIHNRFFEALLTEDTERLAPNTIAVFQSLDNFPTTEAKSLCEACIAAIEADDLHAALLDLLASAERDIQFLRTAAITPHGSYRLAWRGSHGFRRTRLGSTYQRAPARPIGPGQCSSNASDNNSASPRPVFNHWRQCLA